MRLYVFDDYRLGVAQPGWDGLADITDLVPPSVPGPDRMTALIAGWNPEALTLRAALEAGPAVALAEARLLAPQPNPGKVIAAPVNYHRHQQEMGGEGGVYAGASIKTIETYAGFVKASSSIVGEGSAIQIPRWGRRVDHEAELGVVIGRGGRGIGRENALEHVFGFVPLMDITLRGDEDRSFRKSFDTFTPIGPAIVTADEVAEPGDLRVRLTVNGELRQDASTADLIFDIPRLIELYSEAMTLEPGDLIATGTPEGVGPLQDGDEVVLEVEEVGVLRMQVEEA